MHMMALTLKAGLLPEFVRSLDAAYLTAIDVRLRRLFGRGLAEFAEEEPEGLYAALERAVGRHNAEVFFIMFSRWLERRAEQEVHYG
ncbi:hypothetical protein TTX_0507 [Thermoproteus tenax Kra 1]|uniref:Uncharacterized protein n=2 Tax=Thermoproteus tenax TaxID=2271 RepID=G4RNM9_THETK|nr:hypothetical protein TTX_0507 [Thermoproteus tenax Kra 1]